MAANQVSGPGRMSARSDIGDVQKAQDLPNADYGEQQAYQAQQAGAPMAAQPDVMSQAHAQNMASIVPMGAPTQRPGEPVTAGAASGAGPGPESLDLPNMQQQDVQQLASYLPVFEFMANQPNASWASRNLVRQIKAGGTSAGNP